MTTTYPATFCVVYFLNLPGVSGGNLEHKKERESYLPFFFFPYASSQVVVCSEKSTGDVYAMKIMKKAQILQQPDVRIVLYSDAELRIHLCQIFVNVSKFTVFINCLVFYFNSSPCFIY